MPLIVITGIERLNKQYYSGIINKFLKNKLGEENVRKFSFPSYSTKRGQKLAQLIRQFKQEDLFIKMTPHSPTRYKRIAELFLENIMEYDHLVSLYRSHPTHISLVTNYYLSVMAYGLAANVKYHDLKGMIRNHHPQFALQQQKEDETLSIFLVAKDVKKLLVEPPKTHELYGPFSSLNENYSIVSDDYINYFKQVNNYFKQVYLTHTFVNHLFFDDDDSKNRYVLVEVDNTDPFHITHTLDRIKTEVESFLQAGR